VLYFIGLVRDYNGYGLYHLGIQVIRIVWVNRCYIL
jgi:hypothetical protein